MRVSVAQLIGIIAVVGCQQPPPSNPSYVSSGPPGASYEADPRPTDWQPSPPPPQQPQAQAEPPPGQPSNEADPEPPAKQPAQVEIQTPVERKPHAPSGDAQRLVDAHNGYRGQHCAAPLTWSAKLAQVAQQWANSLRDQGCMFGHSNGSYGENLAAGTIGVMGPDEVVRMWYDEVKEYRFPDGGFSMKTGHFTQVVWRGTKQVGCGHVQCKGMDIWVCEYDPPGNVEGEYRDNVKPRGCK